MSRAGCVNVRAWLQVVIAGVTEDGYLHGKTIAGGVRVELEPDGNTFDMMRGLIQRKL